jgi:hypothetical protein
MTETMVTAIPVPPTAVGGGGEWRITTSDGDVAIREYLPGWAEEDPSRTGVAPQLLGKLLADVHHRRDFGGESAVVAFASDPPGPMVVFGVTVGCRPFAEEGQPRVPVANVQIVDDFWFKDLDPEGVSAVAALLRAQADRLEQQVRPALVAARDDWQRNHRTH